MSGGVEDALTLDFRKGGEGMSAALSRTRDILRLDAVNQQRIRDEGAMTTPRHRFGAHDGDPILLRPLDQIVQGFSELRRLHVIRIAAEGGVSPACIRGIPCGMTQ